MILFEVEWVEKDVTKHGNGHVVVKRVVYLHVSCLSTREMTKGGRSTRPTS